MEEDVGKESIEMNFTPWTPVYCSSCAGMAKDRAKLRQLIFDLILHPGGGGGEGGLPSNRLMGMCRWMGSHFHDWIDYNGVAFSIELLEWGRIFSGFGGENILARRDLGY